MDNFKVLRERKNISQACLAEMIGVSQQAIAKWETGESKPRADKLILLAEVLECSIDELLKGA